MAQGNLAMDRREFATAIAAFAIAAKLDPSAIEPRVNGALALALAGDDSAAEGLLREALALAPDDATVNLNLGLLLGGQGRNTEAAEALQKAVAADPRSAVAWFNLCVVVGASNPTEAAPHCGRAVELAPDEPRYSQALDFYSRPAPSP
jgi:Flp pilus assembly protein TadD